MRTKVVIVYSVRQAIRRTVILPHDDADVPLHAANRRPGEAVLVGSWDDYKTIGPDAMLARHLGREPTSDRCAVIDARGIVRHIIRADPAIDTHPDGGLVLDIDGKAAIGLDARTLGLMA